MTRMIENNEESTTLVAFTALAPLAVGGLGGLLAVQAARVAPGLDWAAIIVLAIGLLALVVSVLHLGRPWRAPLALLALGSSWLSREVLLFGVFLIVLGCYAILPVLHVGTLVLSLFGCAGAIIGLAATLATGATYRLHARPAWDRWLSLVSFPLGALSTGSLFGFFAASQFAGRPAASGPAWSAAAVILLASLIIFWLRSTTSRPENPEGGFSRKLVLGPYLWLLVVRVAAVAIALIMIGLGSGAQVWAWIPALLGEFADRVLFFKTVVPVSLRGRTL